MGIWFKGIDIHLILIFSSGKKTSIDNFVPVFNVNAIENWLILPINK